MSLWASASEDVVSESPLATSVGTRMADASNAGCPVKERKRSANGPFGARNAGGVWVNDNGSLSKAPSSNARKVSSDRHASLFDRGISESQRSRNAFADVKR